MTKTTMNNLVLWYQKPAEAWTDALPIGNGRLGAMVFGSVERERIQLNEETLWDGGPRNTNNPKALEALPKVQQLLFEDKNEEATQLAGETMLGVPERIKSYQSLGDLFLEFSHGSRPTEYRRELDLNTGIAKTTYRCGDVNFSTEVFATAVDNLIVISVESDTTGQLAFDMAITREQDATVEAIAANTLRLDGQCGDNGIRFSAYLQVQIEGGEIQSENNRLSVRDADSATLLLAAATSYINQNDASGNPRTLCESYLTDIDLKSYAAIRADHIADHQTLFQRMDLDLGTTDAASLPTDERLEAVKAGASDPGLVALYFQYGRYLMMGSSRPGCLPANLQGIWNEHMNAPWNSDFHTNINLQMNYWVPEICNLAECHIPLFDYMDTLVEPGKSHGTVPFTVLRVGLSTHLSDVWGFTTPADGIWGIWPRRCRVAMWTCMGALPFRWR